MSTTLRKKISEYVLGSLQFFAVFVIILTAVRIGEYLLIEWSMAPALLWPVTGVSISILWLYGYRYVAPIFLGVFIAFAFGPFPFTAFGVMWETLAHVTGFMLTVFLLKWSGFDDSFSNVRNMRKSLMVFAVASLTEPILSFLIMLTTGTFTLSSYIPWQYLSAGHLLSSLLIFPLLVSWLREDAPWETRPLQESMLMGALIIGSAYFLFWVPLPVGYTFIFSALLLTTLFWIGFRFSTQALSLSLIVTASMGIVGIFIAPAPGYTQSEQLLLAELLVFLVVPIFYTISSLVKERNHAFLALEQVKEKIEQESTAKNEFIAVLAHELRNPLAPIKSTLEILSMSELEPETMDLVTRSRQEVRAMQRLLSDLLDITRVTRGKFELRVSNVNLHELIQHCIDSTKYVFKDRAHTIVVDPKSEDNLWLSVDPVRFEQVLVNILMNAAKYTDHSGEIKVSTRILDGRVEISIRDNGIGIEEENLAHIFKPFWQRTKTAHSLTGIGVGLWLTKRIVEMHGGEIRVESEGKGKGSVFTITVPILFIEPPLAQQEASELDHDSPRFRILVCDDNKPAADSLTKLLGMKGHEAKAVYSGQAALDEVHQFKPEIVLLDIGLTDMTGYTVAKKMRADGFEDKIIALSGYAQEEDRKEALRSGFDHHFTKPMSIEAFEKYIQKVSVQ